LSRRRSRAGRAGAHPCWTPYSVDQADRDLRPRRGTDSASARARGFGRPFCLLNYRPTGSNSTPQLTALMRRAIVIQPVRCKPFGPALNGEIRKPPCGVRPFQVGWGGGGFRAALFAGVANKNSAAVFQRRAHLPSQKGAHLAPSRSGRLRGGCLHPLSRP
jgi:hypothetical protein